MRIFKALGYTHHEGRAFSLIYRISIYIPESHVDVVKQALFAAGAGRYQNYDRCSWQTLGMGQFRPLKGSSPFVGDEMVVETVAEYKVEMVCEAQYIKEAVKALILSHPYEEPAYEIYEFKTLDDLGDLGDLGDLNG